MCQPVGMRDLKHICHKVFLLVLRCAFAVWKKEHADINETLHEAKSDDGNKKRSIQRARQIHKGLVELSLGASLLPLSSISAWTQDEDR